MDHVGCQRSVEGLLRLSGQQDDKIGGYWRSMEGLLLFSINRMTRLGMQFWRPTGRLLTGLNADQSIWLWIMLDASCSMEGLLFRPTG
ncbi:hypothetical protein Nepgr_016388 [Nepenthes gracilis]|uniref:Uncharacterized protein n=1 Tax=Nepenthes gracilis TaxID=150966 RepID=A0AAD3XR96_NEPGR|nr:hypothetical protein Nepgr_016388 [Nepenthes gracilis]